MVVTLRNILTASLLCLVYSQSDNCGTSVLPLVSRGKLVRPGQYPWLAALYQNDDHSRWNQVCGGVLISPRIVLTAAHCLVNSSRKVIDANDIKVGLGKLYRDFYKEEEYAIVVNVTTIAVPDRYLDTASSYALDVGLLRLASVVEISDYILPVCIDLDTITPVFSGATVYVAGWGKNENGTTSEQALAARMTYMDYNTCLLKVGVLYRKYVTHDKICALSTNGSYVDQGDSGGALTFSQHGRHYVVGVVSTKIIGNTTFSIFTDLSSTEIRAWIKEHKTNFERDFCPPQISDSLLIWCNYGNTEIDCSRPMPPTTIATRKCKPTRTGTSTISPQYRAYAQNTTCKSDGTWSDKNFVCREEVIRIPFITVIEEPSAKADSNNASTPTGKEEDSPAIKPWQIFSNGTSVIVMNSHLRSIPNVLQGYRPNNGSEESILPLVRSNSYLVSGFCKNSYIIYRINITEYITADCSAIGNSIVKVNGSVVIGTPKEPYMVFINTPSTAVVISGGKCVKKLYSNFVSVPGNTTVSDEECTAVLEIVAAALASYSTGVSPPSLTGKMNIVAIVGRENGKCIRKFLVSGKGITDTFGVDCSSGNILHDDGTVFIAGSKENPFILYSKTNSTLIALSEGKCNKYTYFHNTNTNSYISEDECKAVAKEIRDNYISKLGD